MIVYDTSKPFSYAPQQGLADAGRHVCTVCERDVYSGEACYCFEGAVVCENCCNEYVMDHYWYATPEDI